MTNEQKEKEKKDYPILYGVAIATIMLFVNTIYNLFLAHIWPVTIHFGEYCFNDLTLSHFKLLKAKLYPIPS